MPDPFEALRQPVTPIAPADDFSSALRSRLDVELGIRSDQLTPNRPADTTRSQSMSDTATPVRAQVITPYLCASDANAALAFYSEAFGAFEQMRVTGDDGRLGHAEFTIGEARFMLSDEYPEIGVSSPTTLGGTPVALYLEVVDVDHTYARATEAGATGLRPPEDQAHGNRNATIVDPFGHRWMLSHHLGEVSLDEYAQRETGDFTVTDSRSPVEPGYITMHTGDGARAAEFFGALFDWQIEEGNAGPGYGHVANTTFPMGFAPLEDLPSDRGPVTLFFRVDSIERYATKVEALGGRVLSRNEYDSGGNAECVDDQGMRFDLFQPAPGY
jgi:PhnB protein